MKEQFASAQFGLIGLLFFLVLFIGVLAWLFLPGSKDKFKQYGLIPLKDGQDD